MCHPHAPECLYEDINGFLQPTLRDRMDAMQRQDSFQTELLPVVRAGRAVQRHVGRSFSCCACRRDASFSQTLDAGLLVFCTSEGQGLGRLGTHQRGGGREACCACLQECPLPGACAPLSGEQRDRDGPRSGHAVPSRKQHGSTRLPACDELLTLLDVGGNQEAMRGTCFDPRECRGFRQAGADAALRPVRLVFWHDFSVPAGLARAPCETVVRVSWLLQWCGFFAAVSN